MRLAITLFVSTFLLTANAASASGADYIRAHGAQGVNLWRLANQKREKDSHISQRPILVVQDNSNIVFKADTEEPNEFPDQWFTQPIDHLADSSDTFEQRYWINTRHYTPGSGGPVIVLDGGETSGEDRIPFLDTGIVEILARATGGIGVVLEHRYYGKSIPVSDFSTDNLRWLNNDQSAADSAHFMANVTFPGIDEDLTAPNTAWIYYGGSYAGARAAHMKVLYPDLVYGAIASSAVTHAALSNWEYHDIIRNAADPTCAGHLEHATLAIDALLSVPFAKRFIKSLFGLEDLAHDDDFVSVLEAPLGYWQAKVWDPAVGSTKFDEFCAFLDKPILGNRSLSLLPVGHEDRLVDLPGDIKLDFSILNYAQYIKENYVSQCDTSVEDCFGTYNDSNFLVTGLDQEWRLWLFQVCTEWGYFSTAPPDPDQPRIVSKLLTLEYSSKICKQAYPAGKYFVVPPMPNITAVNALGDFAIAADKLAFIDGEVDPWRPCTPHSDYAVDREDTILQPFKIIPNAVHHYDEYGLKNISDEPEEIRKIHVEMIAFVMEWLKDFKAPGLR
ncbi:serine carboxypeptidase S28-domain-containing protein [Suillus spraguei]|nr:serine carboxypeptidase S28-domain-containing protein [Suillus spraguei]